MSSGHLPTTGWRRLSGTALGSIRSGSTISTAFASGGRKRDRNRSKSSTTIEEKMTKPAKLPPMHPGEVLREEFLEPLGLSPYALAKAIGVPRTRIERITREEVGITADTALRLARYFGTTSEF